MHVTGSTFCPASSAMEEKWLRQAAFLKKSKMAKIYIEQVCASIVVSPPDTAAVLIREEIHGPR